MTEEDVKLNYITTAIEKLVMTKSSLEWSIILLRANLTCFEGVFYKVLFYYLLAFVFDKYANTAENANGVAYPAINDDGHYCAVISLLPLNEQKRIISRVEEIFKIIKKSNLQYGKSM